MLGTRLYQEEGGRIVFFAMGEIVRDDARHYTLVISEKKDA